MGVRHCIAGGVFVLAVAVHLPAQEAPAAMSVAVEEGRLTCDIRMVPLSQVLQALAERTGVTFVPADTIREAYEEAVQLRYLWHEFGDLNLIL